MGEYDDLELELLTLVLAARLPEEEPISQWYRERDRSLKLRVHDQALLVGRCEYHVHRDSGWVEVRDYTDPRSMRSQFYQPDRPGQPYLSPHAEERGAEWA